MSFFYLATPYTKYKDGIDAAFDAACREVGHFIQAGLPVYSPIVHCHAVAKATGLNPLDHDLWLNADQPFMDAAHGLIVCELDGWKESYGVDYEIKAFARRGKPIINMTPGQIPWEELARMAWLPVTA